MASSSLEVRDLSLALGGREVLRGVELELRAGELVAIVGPNGAGKSTLLKCVDRILTGYHGSVFIDGVPTDGMSSRALARRAAYLPQMTEPLTGTSVRRFVELGRYPWRGPFDPEGERDRRAVGEALALTGAGTFAERDMGSLSGGERQRALLAAALAQDAPLLLLDEPTTYLDYRHQVEMAGLIRAVHRQGRTVLTVTHDLNFALQTAGRIIVLSGGRVAWEGRPADLAGPGALDRIFDTEFLRFAHAPGGVPFVVPAAFAEDRP